MGQHLYSEQEWAILVDWRAVRSAPQLGEKLVGGLPVPQYLALEFHLRLGGGLPVPQYQALEFHLRLGGGLPVPQYLALEFHLRLGLNSGPTWASLVDSPAVRWAPPLVKLSVKGLLVPQYRVLAFHHRLGWL